MSTSTHQGKPTGPRKLAERTATNAVWNLVPFGWSACLNVVALPLIISRLGFKDYGLYGLFAIFLAPLTLANLGFGEATIKYVAHYAGLGDLETAARYIRTTFFMNLVVGAAGGLLLCTLGPVLAFKFVVIPQAQHHLVSLCFYCVAGGWVSNQMAGVFMGVPAALQDFKSVAMLRIVGGTITNGLALAVVWAGGGLLGYTLATAVSSLILATICYWTCRKLFGTISLSPRLFREAWVASFRFGGWQTLGQIGGMLSSQSDQLIITSLFSDAKLLGYLNTAATIEGRIYAVVFRMSEVLFPLFSQLGSESLAQKADKLLRSSWLLTTLAVAALAPLIPLAKPLLTIYINPEAGEHIAMLLRILALGGILGCATSASYFYLLGNGKTEWTATISIVSGVVNTLAGLVVLPVYGFAAAAVPGIAAMLAQQYLLGARMLPAMFAGQISRWKIWGSLYMPVLTTAPTVIVCWLIRPERFIHGYATLVPAYFIISGLCIGGVVLSNRLLASGRTHEEDLRRVVNLGGGIIRAKLRLRPGTPATP